MRVGVGVLVSTHGTGPPCSEVSARILLACGMTATAQAPDRRAHPPTEPSPTRKDAGAAAWPPPPKVLGSPRHPKHSTPRVGFFTQRARARGLPTPPSPSPLTTSHCGNRYGYGSGSGRPARRHMSGRPTCIARSNSAARTAGPDQGRSKPQCARIIQLAVAPPSLPPQTCCPQNSSRCVPAQTRTPRERV